MTDPLDGLNESQREAVLTAHRHVLVVAGPGTGKTLAIVRRIAHAMERGAGAGEMLAVTFTNRAAREMRERVAALLGEHGSGMFIGTFHLLGLKILRDCGLEFAICTRDEQIRVLQSITGASARTAQTVADRISRVKNLVETADQEAAQVIDVYQELLEQKGLRDFDDLISIPADLLKRARMESAFLGAVKYVIVDEYQDISPSQYRFLRWLTDGGADLCAVGDSDQAIYAFRGADIRNFLAFAEDFPRSKTVVLKQNYRSTGTIVNAASAVIRNNRQRIEKELSPGREDGKPITIVSVPDERAEADAIAREIEAHMGGTSHYRLAGARKPVDFCDNTCAFSDFAVLYRTNRQAKVFQEAFAGWGLPFRLVGEKPHFPTETLIERLREQIDKPAEILSIERFVESLAEGAGVSEADRTLMTSLCAAYSHLPPPEALTGIINELSVFTAMDSYDARADSIALMTLHMAKGLEFRVVFLAGVEEGLIPLVFGREDVNVEEERRLFYVGMTRAQDELVLLHARKRSFYGRHLSGSPSPFLSEIPRDLIRSTILSDRAKRKEQRQMGLFD